MKDDAKNRTRKRNGHAILVRLPLPLHRQLRDRARDEQRSVVGHVRHLIERDLTDEDAEPEEIAA